MDASTIFHRTESGRETIKTKNQKLTQSERLLLIIIDGVTPLEVLRKEVWSLSPARFERALGTLLKKELISEVLLPLHGQEAEQLETTEIDRFLQQDPLDPVTIISFDPEDEFGVNFNPFAPPDAGQGQPQQAQLQAAPAEAAPQLQPEPSSVMPELATEEVAVIERPAPRAVQSAEPIQQRPTPEPNPENPALKSLSIKLAHDQEQETDSFLAPPPALPSPVLAVEPVPNLSDEWPEDFDRENAEPIKGQWVYWVALMGGIGIILVSLLYRAFT